MADATGDALSREIAAFSLEQAEKGRWDTFPPLSSREAGNKRGIKTPPAPQACSARLSEASQSARLAQEGNVQAKRVRDQAARKRGEKDDAERSAETAVREAEERQRQANHRLEVALRGQKVAENARRSSVAETESAIHFETDRGDRAVEKARNLGDADVKRIRREIAEEKERASRELAELRSAAERRCQDLERSVSDLEAQCSAEVAALDQRAKEAIDAARRSWRVCEDNMLHTHTEADGKVELHQRGEISLSTEANRQLETMEAGLEAEIRACILREDSSKQDRAAEARADAAEFASKGNILRRQQESADLLEAQREEMRKLRRSAEVQAASETEKTRKRREAADEQVNIIWEEFEQYAKWVHQDGVLGLQAGVSAKLDDARAQFAQRLAEFQSSSRQQTCQATEALVEADRAIELLRVEAGAELEEKAYNAQRSIEQAHRERKQISNEGTERLQLARQERSRFIAGRQEENLAQLARAETPEVPVQLHFSDYCGALESPVVPY